MSLLQMSFSGAALILAIMVVRAVAINKLPKKTFVFLWGLVLVRLLIPFSIPSKISVYSLVDQNTYADTFDRTPISNMLPIMPEVQMEPIGDAEQMYMQQQPLVERVSEFSVWLVIWCIGMLLITALFVMLYLKWLLKFQTARTVHNSYVEQWLNTHRLIRPISIRQLDKIDTPLTYGILHPVILMPEGTDWEDTKQLQYILLHEYVHICRYDAVIKLISTLALCIHWFNPFVWIMYLLFNRDLELSCDESVVRRFGVASRTTYAHILINMETKKSDVMPFYNSFSKNAIEERITSIMKTKKTSLYAILFAVVLIIGIASVFVTSAAKQPDPQQEPVSPEDIIPDNAISDDVIYDDITSPVSETDNNYGDLYTFTVQVSGERELTVVLDTSQPQENYFSIDQILVYEGEELLQTIETTSVPPVEDYLWEGLFVNRGYVIGEPDIRDLNFDGSQDFGLLAVSGYPHNVPYSYFLWNKTEGQFNYGFTLFGSGALEIDAENQRLIEHSHDVMGQYTTIYSYASDGSLLQQ